MSRKRLITFLLISVFIVFFLFPELQKRPAYFLSRPFVYIISMMQAGFMTISQGIGGIWLGYMNLVGVKEENRLLREDLDRLRTEHIRLLEAEATLKRLETFLQFKEQNPSTMIAARIIGRDPTNWFKTLVIDKGVLDGVSVDMGVVVPSGVVGRIMKTFPGASRVQLLTDRSSAIAAFAQRTRDEGIVEGTEKGMAKIKYLPVLSKLQVGDRVLTSGLAESFPRGLLLGRIYKAETQNRALFQEAELIPSVDFSHIEEVLVIPRAKEVLNRQMEVVP